MTLARSLNRAKLQRALFFTDVDKRMKNVTNTNGLAHSQSQVRVSFIASPQSIKNVVTCEPSGVPDEL